MSKQLKDYLHLYLGQQCITKMNSIIPLLPRNIDNCIRHEYKLLLRPLWDMTDEEKWESEIYRSENMKLNLQSQRDAHYTLWLMNKGFDLFGLIEDGLAIDKTTLK